VCMEIVLGQSHR